MNTRRLTLEKIMDHDHYRNIFLLTRFFDQGKGLQPLHYRWALCPEHDGINQPDVIKALQVFFSKKDNELETLYLPGLIKKDSVSSRTNLSNFLSKMVTYGLLETIDIDRYRIPKKIIKREADIYRKILIKTIKELPADDIMEVNELILRHLSDKMIESLGFGKYNKT